MARKPEYKNPRTFSVTIEAEIKEEIDEFRGKLSYGKVFTMLWRAYKGEVVKAIELENLRRENEELKKRIEELQKLVQRLQDELAKYGGISKREREALDLREEAWRILDVHSELKLIDFFRMLGWSEMGETLKKKAEVFLRRWFRDEGKYLVSEELGLVVEKKLDVGILAWRVRRLAPDVDSFRTTKVGVVV
ncbi:hypothetical protein [Pyrococcus yayanosii]|uniref:Uncharacterized protein n=1 Tax=Pyrococcus yayanosii (strain CH1 / JCM 16557) TaxID=529709 RepID=F8AJF8_PYRYC|nr:hypothetical protein [Pyrococcus yayanosii]AEH25102.1 hypothetical protein PYCH_14320 [Pyrococcus yayanosii CH1]